MLFSIVVPSCNQARFLGACLESVLGQSGVDLEIMVFDGDSRDGSQDVIQRYAHGLAYWQSRPDGGQAAALKAGFALARGDVFSWVNSDDILLPGALKSISQTFSEHQESPLMYGDAVWIDEQDRITQPKREIDFSWTIFAYGYCYIPQPSAFFRREAYLRAGGLDPNLICSMDYDLWHRLCKIGPVVHIPRFLSGLRSHPETKTHRLKEVFVAEHEILRARYLGCSRTSYTVRHLFARALRAAMRATKNHYRPMSPDEIEATGLRLRTSP
jgi:glycosyltransferase involved in cell wall biosynthesis